MPNNPTNPYNPNPVANNQPSTYVFGPGFYLNDRTKMDLFEQATMDYVEGIQQNIDTLMKLYHDYPSWSSKDKYYRLPILRVLLEDYLASMKTAI